VPPKDPAVAAAHAAFHGEIGRINQPRFVPLVSILAVLLAVSAGLAYWQSPASIYHWDSSTWQNLSGVGLAALIYLLHRTSRSPRLVAIAYGYAILGWGNSILSGFQTEVRVRHADHAAEALVVYYVTRYLAAMTVVWRPRDLGLALALNHIVIGWVFYSLGQFPTIINTAVWTTTAWLGAYAVYRAERDTFMARRQLQQQHDQLVVANAHLAQLNQEKNDLMAIAAHDLRSPLMGMTMLLNVTAEEAGRAWQAGVSSLRALEQSCRDMADLVSRVLDVHRAADAVGQLSLQAQDIRPAVAKVTQAHEPRARAKGIDLAVDAGPSPLAAVHDQQALERVLDNLVSNAVKFSPPGGTVRVHLTRAGAMAAIAVSDTGPGIADAERPLLFRKFARLRPKPTAGENSSGLGLYITKQLVDAMGGSIAVSGGPGQGATFTVSLPAATA
jgi:signal transduction histidine kinase